MRSKISEPELDVINDCACVIQYRTNNEKRTNLLFRLRGFLIAHAKNANSVSRKCAYEPTNLIMDTKLWRKHRAFLHNLDERRSFDVIDENRTFSSSFFVKVVSWNGWLRTFRSSACHRWDGKLNNDFARLKVKPIEIIIVVTRSMTIYNFSIYFICHVTLSLCISIFPRKAHYTHQTNFYLRCWLLQ